MAVEGTFSVTIQAPPERVWPWVSQLEKHADWSPKPFRVELVSGQPDAVGARYRSVGWVPGDKDHANQVEITEVVPQQRFAFQAEDPQGVFQNTYTVRPVDGGTEVTHHFVFPPMKGVAGVLLPVLFPLIAKPAGRKRMRLLKARVEAGG